MTPIYRGSQSVVSKCARLYRMLLHPDPLLLDPGLPQPYRLRTGSLGGPNEPIPVPTKPAAGQFGASAAAELRSLMFARVEDISQPDTAIVASNSVPPQYRPEG